MLIKKLPIPRPPFFYSLKNFTFLMCVVGGITPDARADMGGKLIGDLEIYQAPTPSNPVIMLLLGNAMSMGMNSISEDYQGMVKVEGKKCWYPTDITVDSNNATDYASLTINQAIYDDNNANVATLSYTVQGCPITVTETLTATTDNGGNTTVTGYLDRLSRLKLALIPLFAHPQQYLSANYANYTIGLSLFTAPQDNLDNPNTPSNPNKRATGNISLPAKPLTLDNRNHLLKAINDISLEPTTPTAPAYAEVGAYMLGTTTYDKRLSAYSGFSLSENSSKNSAKTAYQSPLSTTQCSSKGSSGNGIFFLTDGSPNGVITENSSSSANSTSAGFNSANALMTQSLSKAGAVIPNFNCMAKTGDAGFFSDGASGTAGGWQCMGSYAKLLNSTANPAGVAIKTATVGLGSRFDNTLADCGVAPSQDITKDITNQETKNQDAKNLCKLGQIGGGYGEGGFTATRTDEGIAKALTDFMQSVATPISALPSGTISVPTDPYQMDSLMAVAYVSMLQARPADNRLIWSGNLKKYHLDNGTLYSANTSTPLFKNMAGDLDSTVQDLWGYSDDANANNSNDSDSDSVTSGGLYSQLPSPNTGVNAVRTVYVQDFTSATPNAKSTTSGYDKTPVLRQLGVNSEGKPTGFDSLIDPIYTQEVQRKLLNFLGFDNLPPTGDVKDLILTAPSHAIKVLGGAVHAKPTAISYSAMLDGDGKITDIRDDYVLFGSMDGALHMVDANDHATSDGGREKFAFIPREMIVNQANALVKNATQPNIGSPVAGVDAPWLVTTNYKYDFANKKVSVSTDNGKGMFAYGGLRMGGEALYGLNLSTANTSAPAMLFSITPQTTGFERMGQIWAKPTPTKIRTTNADNDKGIDVLVFGGGYDTCYENDKFQVGITDSTFKKDIKGQSCSNKAEAQGNALYIISAKNQGNYKAGELIWSASASGKPSTPVPTMKNSIVGEVTVLDRNNDGFMDGLYFADLGGQVFRADFMNAGYKKTSTTGNTTTETEFSAVRVTRILSDTPNPALKDSLKLRFYERPMVSFYRGDGTFNNNQLFALVNVISGDRSSPLSKLRDNDSKADRLYGIMDTDVTQPDSVFFSSSFSVNSRTHQQAIVDLDDSHFTALPHMNDKIAGITAVKANHGWYYPLNRFDGYSGVKYGKGVGSLAVISGFLYSTVYNPDMNYDTGSTCQAKIIGGSERQLYCLPYGVCNDSNSTTGTGGFSRAGRGIQELVFGAINQHKNTQKVLIGTRNLTQRASDTRVNFGRDSNKKLALDDGIGLTQIDLTASNQANGDGSSPDLIIEPRYTLTPNTWYEVTQ